MSEILPHSKLKLLDENLLEGVEVVLLVEDKHGFLVVDGINRAKTQRTIAVGNQDGIACDACCTFIIFREIGSNLMIIYQLSAHGEPKIVKTLDI